MVQKSDLAQRMQSAVNIELQIVQLDFAQTMFGLGYADADGNFTTPA